jgi:hypothetical protein
MSLQNPFISFFLTGFLVLPAFGSEPDRCPITYPEGGVQGNDALQAVLPQDGKFTFIPRGGGFIDRDGALGIKLAWNRLKPGKLNVSGRRLDADARPARGYLYDQGNLGAQSMYLVFPTPGCWEITGSVGEFSLSFVLYVEKIGEGPASRLNGPPSQWRVTS